MVERAQLSLAHVRHARIGDVPEIVRIQAASFTNAWPLADWHSKIESPHALVRVALIGSYKLAGYLLAQSVADEIEIHAIAVDPRYRRRGVASAMLERLIGDMQPIAPCRVFLEVSVQNVAALALYHEHNFAAISIRKAYYKQLDGPAVDAKVLMLQIDA